MKDRVAQALGRKQAEARRSALGEKAYRAEMRRRGRAGGIAARGKSGRKKRQPAD